jgi:hypothetical protein
MKNFYIKKIFKKTKDKKQFEIVLQNWRCLTLTFSVILIVLSLFAWKIYLSNQIGGGYLKIKDNNPSPSIKTIDLIKINKTIDTLKQRDAYFFDIKNKPTKLVDPNL